MGSILVPTETIQQVNAPPEWRETIAALVPSEHGVLTSCQDGRASRLQTMLVQQAVAANQTEVVVPRTTVTTEAGTSDAEETVSVKFDEHDLLGWLSTGLTVLTEPAKAAWLPPPDVPESIPDDATIAVFSDWGTGLYGAPIIAQSIRAMLRCDVVLHLGDTYYSGHDDEIAKRLIGDWPVRPGTVNRTLNGNHEMYSGGAGYFAALQTFFGQSSSCIAMQNTHWLLLGLDTAYDDFTVAPDQVAWITRMIAKAGDRRVILFSHHQIFSALDVHSSKLQSALRPLLTSGRVTAWYWGHEHRLVVYDPWPLYGGLQGRCIGHGGFPSARDVAVGAGGNHYQWIRLKARPEAPAAQLLDGPNFWITAAPTQYSPHGYLLLECDGAHMWETYRTPDNIGLMRKRL
jgi:hypothetical protein